MLADAACDQSPISVVPLPTRHVLPKVRAFTEELRAPLAARGGRDPRTLARLRSAAGEVTGRGPAAATLRRRS
jgi:hypothetical protein